MTSDSTSFQPLVSVITPAFNSEKFLASTIESVLSQSYTNWEMHIVVDAKSTDRSLDIARAFAVRDPRIFCHSDPQCVGVSSNRNYAVERSKGEFIAFLDADDQWLPTKLEKQIDFMLKKSSPISFHSYSTINEEGRVFGPLRKARQDIQYKDLLKNNSMGCLTVVLRRDFLQEHRFKNLRHEDLYLWLELLSTGAIANALPEPLAKYRISPHSLSKNKMISALWRWQIYRKMKISPLRSCYYMMWYFLSAAYKRI